MQTKEGKVHIKQGKVQTKQGKVQTKQGKVQTREGKVQTKEGKVLHLVKEAWLEFLCQTLIYTAERTGASCKETKCPRFEMAAKGSQGNSNLGSFD